MKRFLSALLLCVLIFPLTACRKNNPSNSDVSNETSSSGEQKVNPQIQAINNMLGSGVDRSKGRTNILKGITYKPSREAGDNGSYTDSEHKKLTDGTTAESFNSYSWAGYTGSGTVTITFDLGKSVENIADIEIGCLRQIEYGIGLPGFTEVYASDDGKSYTKLGKLLKSDDISESQKYTFVFHLQGVIKARYIQVKLSNPEKVFMFVDEIAAYVYDGGGSEVKQVKDYYKPFTPSSDALYWDANDADYTKKQNLALGKKVSVISFSSFDSTNAIDKQNSLPENGILTDGKYSEYASWDKPEVFRFTQGDGRQIIIDLEKISAISEVKGDVLQQTEWGIKLPSAIGVSVSVNGTDWQGVSTAEIKPESESVIMVKFSADFKKVYRARYVRLQLLVNPFAAFSEIEVIGTKKVPSDAIVPDPKAVVTRLDDCFITPDKFGGMNNIFCNPICRGDGTTYNESAMITHDEFLKYVGYYEGEKLTDTFFDTFLFSPCSDFTNDADKITLKGWKFYIESQFVADRNLNALNAAAKTVGDGVGKNDLKINVLFSILRTFPKKTDGSVNTFGDINGDGKDDSFDNIENRKMAMKWMIDTQLKKYKDAGFDHLNLAGFYWQEEVIHLDDPQEIELVKWAADYVHKLGYKIMWIPYYQAEGFADWKNYGFDLACLQPNYSFMSVLDKDRLDTTAYQARMHGMCVELELSSYTNRVNIERYKQYLEYGVKYGYMNAVKVYYLGVIPTDLTMALTSKDTYTQSVYRDTYMFAKGKLDESYNKQSAETLTPPKGVSVTTQKKRAVNGKVEIGETGYRYLAITVSPKYGSLRLNLNGSFTYTPFEDYTGTDSFCVAAVYSSGVSENATVNIKVE